MAAGTNITIQGNYIGFGTDGATIIPNGTGVQMQGTGTLGGDLPDERNVISNNQTGIILGEDEVGNSAVIVKGNFIGTNITGTLARGNNSAGINIGSAGHRIENNVISSNGTTGIGITSIAGVSLATDNVITGNKIGTDVSGLNPLPNAVGIIFQGPSNDNIVGEGLLAPYEGNTIAFNTGPGIYVDNQQTFGGIPEGNTFRKNSIFNNGDLGIKIKTSAQAGILPPIIDSLKEGILYGHGAIPDARIDVYEAEPDPSGAGEGRTWLANGTAIGDGTFEIPVTNTNCKQPTVTQTDPNRNTSQFSENLRLDPEVKSLTPSCSQTFLVGVSLVNPFTATLDWKGVPEAGRSVTFNLNGNVHQGNLSGNIATTTYNMAGISAETNTMVVKAASCAGTSPDFTYQFCGTTVPEWAGPAGSIIGSGASCDAIYSKTFLFPDPAIVPNMPFISSIPFIGGALGFLSTQGHVTMRASSAGGTITNEDVGLNSDFSLAGESFNLSTSGTTNTTLACGSLNLDGSLTATVSVSHTYSWGTSLSSLLPATSGPLMGEIRQLGTAIGSLASLGAEVGGSIRITANYQARSSVEFTTGSGTGEMFIHPFINLFPFRAVGSGAMTVQVTIPSFDTQAQLTFEFTVFGPSDVQLFHREFSWPGGGSPGFFAQGINTASFNHLIKTNKSNKATFTSFAEQDTLIVSGIPSDGTPIVALGPNGRRVIAWSHFNASAARPSGDIGIKIFNGTTWGPNIFLNSDIQVDQKPTAAFDNTGHIIVCWERNLTTDIPPDTAIYVARYLQGFDIQYAILDANNGTVQNTGTYGNVNDYDFSPRLSRGIDGSVLLVWESTSGNTIFGNVSDPASLISVRWNGAGWGTPTVVSNLLTGVHNWEAANRSSDTSLVALVLDTDGDLSTPGDWEVFASLWNGTVWSSPARLTNDGSVDWGVHCTYVGDGRSALGWLKDSVVVGVLGDVTQQPTLWLGDSNNVGLEFINGKLAAGGGKLLLAWPEVGNITYSNASIAQPIWSRRVSRSTESEERSLSLAVDENGKGIFGYLSVPFSGNSSNLSDTADIYITTMDISSNITSVKYETPRIPDRFILMDAYPNPFNPSTTIQFSLPQAGFATLKIYNTLGEEVTSLISERLNAGTYSKNWNAANMASGIYFYRLFVLTEGQNGQAGSYIETKKLVFLK